MKIITRNDTRNNPKINRAIYAEFSEHQSDKLVMN